MLRLAIVLSVSLLPACLARGQQPIDQHRAERLLAVAKAQMAPDRRTVVFDVTAAVEGRRLTLTGEVHDASLERRLLEHFAANADCEIENRLRALPDPALGDRTMGIVCVSVANLRSKPGHAQELGTQALLGTPLRILKRSDGWSYVQTPNDYLCWTNDRIQSMNPEEYASWQRQPKVIVTATFGVVRESRVPGALPVSDVVAGCVLGAGTAAAGYFPVSYADGRTGYLETSAAMPMDRWLARTAGSPTGVVSTARRFLGVPYLWGGTSCKGMDCSGFTSTVFFLNGILLPRDASQQVLVGEPIEIDPTMKRVQAGDLLFFGRAATADRRERVTHVGISLGGPRFIHSSTDVHENSLDAKDPNFSASLKRRLLHVRRILGAPPSAGIRRLDQTPYYRSHDD